MGDHGRPRRNLTVQRGYSRYSTQSAWPHKRTLLAKVFDIDKTDHRLAAAPPISRRKSTRCSGSQCSQDGLRLPSGNHPECGNAPKGGLSTEGSVLRRRIKAPRTGTRAWDTPCIRSPRISNCSIRPVVVCSSVRRRERELVLDPGRFYVSRDWDTRRSAPLLTAFRKHNSKSLSGNNPLCPSRAGLPVRKCRPRRIPPLV